MVAGTGLHTGRHATVHCRPAPSGHGIRFRRTDLPDRPEIAARVDAVSATERRTALEAGPASVDTVEHLLAAVAALELDDLLIELDGPEPPILDGSFAPYLRALEEGGVTAAAGEPRTLVVEEPWCLELGDSRYEVLPSPELRLTTTIEWDHPAIGRQSGSWAISLDAFRRDIAPARTFGFTHEVEALRARGLLKGGSMESAVVLSPEGVLAGAPLRWPDEFVRHKTGDILGDLALLGGRLQAHIVATRPSHQGNIAVARRLARTTAQRGGRMLDIARILEVLPHRYPLLMVDRIVELEPGKRAVGLKNVSINEPFFAGHFPGHPIMPGVLIVEAMAQTGGMLLMDALTEPPPKVVYFMALDQVKFRRPVVPGDQLRLEVSVLQLRGRNCRLQGMAYVAGQLVAEAEMLARVVDR
jgi:UDP-3-O-[3-hydroxymyristoyl] N-acetylglucosamine deacetylase/3-hydroxyacyl-[acyl-carrier-protein] dehydratase